MTGPAQDPRASAARSLDPQVAKLLAWVDRAGAPSYRDLGAAAARAHYASVAGTLDIAPTPMHAVDDLAVQLAGRTLRVRHYVPREHGWADPMPALLYFHGGGFTIGSVDTHDRICRMLARDGDCVVLSVDYRLAPEHPFPAAADDAFDTLAWLRREAYALGVDPQRIAVGGDSAGGTLATAAAIHARDAGWPLALQLLIYPGVDGRQATPSHREFGKGFLLDFDLVTWFFSNYIRREADWNDWRFAPLSHPDLRGVAPAWIAIADHDPLRDDDRAYAARLREAGVAVDALEYPGMIHAFFQHGGFVPTARRAHADAAAALRTAFAGP
jgi:acetyl esterase